MPKANATKARPARSPKKKPVSAKFVDDEAEESAGDEGVLVEKPTMESRDTPPAYLSGDHDLDADEGDQGSDDGFINDGDPYEGYQSDDDGVLSPVESPPSSPIKSKAKRQVVQSPSPTPPSTPIKSRAHQNVAEPPVTPSPKKTPSSTNSGSKGEVIELESSSEEDLEAMDIDDSEFKKPSGIKAAALPPSLLTRSAASKRSLTVADSNSDEPDGSAVKRAKRLDKDANVVHVASQDSPNTFGAMEGLPFGSNPEMAKMMGAWVMAFMKDNPGLIDAATSATTTRTRSPSAGPSTRPAARKSKDVDFDELALQEGIRSSLESPLRLKNPKPRYSPDWEPPAVADIIKEVAKNKKRMEGASVSKKSKSAAVVTGVGGKKATVDGEPIDTEQSRSKRAGKNAVAKTESEDEQLKSKPGKKAVGKAKERVPFICVEDALSIDTKDDAPPSVIKKGKGKAKAPSDSGHEVGAPAKANNLSAYLLVKKFPVVSTAVGDEDGKPPVTMAQYMRMARGEPEPEEATAESPAADPEETPVFLEDIEAYKAFYDPKAKCGVFDVKIQDPSMRPHYIGLPPLPGGRMLLAAFDPKRNSTDDVDYRTGGRVAFSKWAKVLPKMLASNSMGAMLFVEGGERFINLSRCSPLGLSAHTSAGSSQTARLQIGDKVAVCVSSICVTESCLFAPKAVGRGDRYRKWVLGITHDYDHERLVSMLSLIFGEPILYAQIVEKALSFQTMISPANDSGRTPDSHHYRPTKPVPSPNLFSSQSPAKATPSRRSNNTHFGKTLLAYNDTVPIYDARKIVVDFNSDLDRLGQVLPLFPGEIPVSSFVVVGYTVSCYKGTISGSASKAANISFNVLWAIVCGTPAPPSRT